MKKNIIILILSITFINKCFAQKFVNRSPELSYYGQYVQVYFDNYKKMYYNNEFSKAKEDIEIIARFNIDTSGNVINLTLNTTDSLKEIADYISKMINATNGYWLPAIKNCMPSISEPITCSFFILNRSAKPSYRRMEKLEKQRIVSNGWLDITSVFGNGVAFDYYNLFVLLDF